MSFSEKCGKIVCFRNNEANPNNRKPLLSGRITLDNGDEMDIAFWPRVASSGEVYYSGTVSRSSTSTSTSTSSKDGDSMYDDITWASDGDGAEDNGDSGKSATDSTDHEIKSKDKSFDVKDSLDVIMEGDSPF